jgi:hypothetical protein
MSETPCRIGDGLQGGRRRLSELHVEPPGAQITQELLPKQLLDVMLVVHHEN